MPRAKRGARIKARLAFINNHLQSRGLDAAPSLTVGEPRHRQLLKQEREEEQQRAKRGKKRHPNQDLIDEDRWAEAREMLAEELAERERMEQADE